jgi:crotonobetainyl-CoA:carnitine CoA-transferase CaiB-like acyl-CoA transferase
VLIDAPIEPGRSLNVAGALDGIRVIDFGQWIAAPLATMLLADHGAEVIHVDPPGGPRWKTPANATLNRGKIHVELDVKAEGGRAAARRLIASADVVVENFRPGVMERLGLGAESCLSSDRRLIYCSIPGFASDDPRSGVAAWEGIIAAATASYSPGAGRTNSRPRFTALPISSSYGALVAATAIAMALVARERDGRGQRIEAPLFDATFTAIGASGLFVDGKPAGGRPDDPWGGLFLCADGGYIRLNLATPRFVRQFLKEAGLDEWIDQGYLERDALVRGTALRALQERQLSELLYSRTAIEWDELGRRAGVPLTRVRSGAEWLNTPEAQDARIISEIGDPEVGPTLQAGLAVRLLDPSGPDPAPRKAPLRSIETLFDHVVPGSTGTAQASRRIPLPSALDGIRVLDLTQVLAGPTSGRTLAEYGAEVIKINNPSEEGAGYRWNVHRYHTDVNRGKHSLLLDLKQPEGMDLFWRLATDADIVIHNFRPGVPERLGISYEQVRARRPGIVYGSVGMFGSGGAWSGLPGYEVNAQAVSGMLARTMDYGPPFAVNDYATGLLAAFGLGLALFHRQRTGNGQRVEAALARTASMLQAPYLQLYEGKCWDEPTGPNALGWHLHQRLYEAADGWFFLGAKQEQAGNLTSALGVGTDAEDSGPPLERRIEEKLLTRTVAGWRELLKDAGIAVQELTSVSALMHDPWAIEHGLSIRRRHDDGADVTTVGPAARLSATPVRPGRPAPSPGADAAGLLASLGMADRLSELVAKGIIALG